MRIIEVFINNYLMFVNENPEVSSTKIKYFDFFK